LSCRNRKSGAECLKICQKGEERINGKCVPKCQSDEERDSNGQPGQQQDARDVSERYITKSNPYIAMVSTPNAPDGLFERIEKEPEGICLYTLSYKCPVLR
jgi:hypothetical protein